MKNTLRYFQRCVGLNRENSHLQKGSRSIFGLILQIFIGLLPCPVTGTTRIIIFLVGDPNLNLHLPLGGGTTQDIHSKALGNDIQTNSSSCCWMVQPWVNWRRQIIWCFFDFKRSRCFFSFYWQAMLDSSRIISMKKVEECFPVGNDVFCLFFLILRGQLPQTDYLHQKQEVVKVVNNLLWHPSSEGIFDKGRRTMIFG